MDTTNNVDIMTKNNIDDDDVDMTDNNVGHNIGYIGGNSDDRDRRDRDKMTTDDDDKIGYIGGNIDDCGDVIKDNDNEVILITGTMFVGKTTTLMEMYEKELDKTKVQFITHGLVDKIKTHSNIEFKDFYLKLYQFSDFIPYEKTTTIYIDEIQFFPDLFDFILKNRQYKFILAGLSTDYKREPFLEVAKIATIATKHEILKTYCNVCSTFKQSKDALFNLRFINVRKNVPRILIGGSNIYTVTCNKCYENIIKGM